MTHAVGSYLNTPADYAIAADFCNFDQDNGSNVHNCIYRIEAEAVSYTHLTLPTILLV